MKLPPFRADITEAEVLTACSTLETIFRNILQHPLDEKYRRISLNSQTWNGAAKAFEGDSLRLFFVTALHSSVSADDRRLHVCAAASEPPEGSAWLGMDSRSKLCMCLSEEALAAVEKEKLSSHSHRALQRPTVATSDATERTAWWKARLQMAAVPPCEWSYVRRSLSGDNAATSTTSTEHSRMMEDYAAAFPTTSLIPLSASEICELDAVAEVSPVLGGSEEARRRLKDAWRRAEDDEARRRGVCKWPQEVQLVATSLIADIGGIIEQCDMLSTEHHRETSSSAAQRIVLLRRDRIEMRRLLEKFNTDGDVGHLHNVKAEWEATLLAMKRDFAKPLVFS